MTVITFLSNTNTDNSNISSEQFSQEDNVEIRNNSNIETDPMVSPDNDEEESTNADNINGLLTSDDEENNIVDNINPILMNSDDDQEDSTDSVNEIMETGKSILLLGMFTVDVEGTVKTKGSRNIMDECLTTTARNCVIKNIISINDGRDLARINSIRCYDKSNVYTVSLVNTTSNPTVYDTNSHFLNLNFLVAHT